MLSIPQSSSITGTSPSDGLVSYPGNSLGAGGGLTPLQRSSQCILQPQPTGQSPSDVLMSYPRHLFTLLKRFSQCILQPQLARLEQRWIHAFIKKQSHEVKCKQPHPGFELSLSRVMSCVYKDNLLRFHFTLQPLGRITYCLCWMRDILILS